MAKVYGIDEGSATRLGRAVRLTENLLTKDARPKGLTFPAQFAARYFKLQGHLHPSNTEVTGIPHQVVDPEAGGVTFEPIPGADPIPIRADFSAGWYYQNSVIPCYWSSAARKFYPLQPGQIIVPAKTNGAIAKGNAGNVTVYTRGFAASTGQGVTAHEEGLICFDPIAANKKIRISWQTDPDGNGRWSIVSAEK